MVTPERIAKISQAWVKDYIASLERHNRYLTEGNRRLRDQLDLAASTHAETKTNVRLSADDIEIALPEDSTVILQGKFEVTPSANDADGITIELIPSGGLVIIPDTEGRIWVRAGTD